MVGSLFITGATGFVGGRVLRALPPDSCRDLRLLVRDPSRLRLNDLPHLRPRLVAGDLTASGSWSADLAQCDTVLHLAAATGKLRPGVIDATNRVGTERLLEAARLAGVRRFIFVSSIAAGFADQRYYPYAQSKRVAETRVLGSGLDALVVRPTPVLGPGSPTLAGLRRLASAPVGVLFGSGRVMVQPIHVDDLAETLIRLLALSPLGGRTLELGGPECLTMADLLRRVRRTATGRDGPLVRLPAGPIRHLLAAVEPVLFPVLPFTAGQLASFVNEGRPRPDPLVAQIHLPRRGSAAMLQSERRD